MNLHSATRLTSLIILMWVSVTALGQSTAPGSLELVRQNPDGWFTLKLPKFIGKVERFADVDGGFYESDIVGINYDYWTFQNTPNWLRGRYATSLLLACSAKGKGTRTKRAWIDGHRAVIQQCSDTDERKGFRYIYYVTFPKLKVFDGEKFRYGMFNFTIEYKDQRYSTIAGRMVRTLDFER
jgi:hypothetical protein